MADSWPDAWQQLEAELTSGRGRPALIDCVVDGAVELAEAMSVVTDRSISVGLAFADSDGPFSPTALLDGLDGSTLLLDIDVLFSPQLRIDVLSQLRRTAQRGPLVVAWPGRISAGRLLYSRPGRADYFDQPARDIFVLRPIVTSFPDEVPYVLERFPA